MNILFALVTILGQQPWCMTDGDSYDCYYYNPAQCQQVVSRYGSYYWCERNPGVYSIEDDDEDDPWDRRY